jgi:hypothetical protein
MMRTTWKEMVAFLMDWRDYLNGLTPASHAELGWSGTDSDTPIYDELLAQAKHYGWAYPGEVYDNE